MSNRHTSAGRGAPAGAITQSKSFLAEFGEGMMHPGVARRWEPRRGLLPVRLRGSGLRSSGNGSIGHFRMASEKCSLISKKQSKNATKILPQKEVGCCGVGGKVRDLVLCCAAEDACGGIQRAGRERSLTSHPCNV